MPGGSRTKTRTWWETAIPTTGPTSTTRTIRGLEFSVIVPGRIFGMRYYSRANDTRQNWAMLANWSNNPTILLQARPFALTPGNESARWRNCWFHPAVPVVTGVVYHAYVFFPFGGYFRTVDRLNPLNDRETHGIDVEAGVTVSAFDPLSGVLTKQADAYGVDVLFEPDNADPLPYP